MSTRASEKTSRRSAWLSHGLEELAVRLADRRRESEDFDFDVVVVGSGYGGAVAAQTLSRWRRPASEGTGEALKVCVLERGREYLPGAFASRMSELPGHVRFAQPGAAGASGTLEGLFDVRLGPHVNVLVANGLGGGSLINAGVMEMPRQAVFQELAWPSAIRARAAEVLAAAAALRERLGGGSEDALNTVERPGASAPARVSVLKQLAPSQQAFKALAVTVALREGHRTVAGVSLKRCVGCGDCATGCNHGAKESLDTNLLVQAARQGAEIYTGATVVRLRRWKNGSDAEAGAGWELDVWPTDLRLRRRAAAPLRLRAARVVLAAGSLGSTELLLRSRTPELRFSGRLGERWSANGDAIAAIANLKKPVAGTDDEIAEPSSRGPGGSGLGPTITAMIDLREGDGAGDGHVVQDLAVPAALQRLFAEITTTAAALQGIGRADKLPHAPHDPDPCAVDPHRVACSLGVALIGRDAARGRVEPGPDDGGRENEGSSTIVWPEAGGDARMERWHRTLAERVDANRTPLGDDATVLRNPMWQALAPELTGLLGTQHGPVLSVHPLGGCVMADDRETGVVDHLGRVFDANSRDIRAVHDGLLVLDGAIVPGSLGINPALTIATLADRALTGLHGLWLGEGARVDPPRTDAGERPVFRSPPGAASRQATTVGVHERLAGWVCLGIPPFATRKWLELTLVYRAAELSALTGPDPGGRVLEVDPASSRLRIFDVQPPKFKEAHDSQAKFIAPLSGTLSFLQRERSSYWWRVARGFRALVCNRGIRDWRQTRQDRRAGLSDGGAGTGRGIEFGSLLGRAGEARRFDYELTLGVPRQGAIDGWIEGAEVKGRKRLSYTRAGNPLRQLMELRLIAHPGLVPCTTKPVLKLDLPYFARQGILLLRVLQQRDQPQLLADLASLGLYFARLLLSVHLFTFRKPDAPSPRPPHRLPGRVAPAPGPLMQWLPPDLSRWWLRRQPALEPQVHELPLPSADGEPTVHVRLTRYPLPPRPAGRAHAKAPVLLIHGYSAGGTTFTHPSLDLSLVAWLVAHGREPWVLDLRTSCGLATAAWPWSFEQVARGDIPAAVSFVCESTGCPRVDVVAHCMGAAMFSMALLDPDVLMSADPAMPERIGRVVLSQVGPEVVFSPANVARAWLIRYAIHLLDRRSYSFRPDPTAGASANAFDRLLAALPYPESQFRAENPLGLFGNTRRAWVGTRHRLDALFGEVFNPRNLSRRTLDAIDDLFGPIHFATASQTVHFRQGVLTDAQGVPWFRAVRGMRSRLAHIKMLSLHNGRNGLADPETELRIGAFLDDFGIPWTSEPFPKLGHQDGLVGRRGVVLPVFRRIERFLAGRG